MKPINILYILAIALGILAWILIGYKVDSFLQDTKAADFKIDIVRDEKITNELLSKTYEPLINVPTGIVRRDSNDALDNTKQATVTAYSELDTCPSRPCIMASGKKAYIGAMACPRKDKFGTKKEIVGVIYTCEDRTALKYDGRYDIWTGTGVKGHLEAIKWGKRRLEVRIIK